MSVGGCLGCYNFIAIVIGGAIYKFLWLGMAFKYLFLFLKDLFICVAACVNVCVFCLNVCKCITFMSGACGGQKRVLDPQNLELQAVFALGTRSE